MVQAVHFLQAGWRSDIDFNQIISQDINPHEIKAELLQMRLENTDDFFILGIDCCWHGFTAGKKIITVLTVFMHAQQSAQDFSAQKQDTLVAVLRFGNIFLDHNGVLIASGQSFQDNFCIGASFFNMENTCAPEGIGGFGDDIFMFGNKIQ